MNSACIDLTITHPRWRVSELGAIRGTPLLASEPLPPQRALAELATALTSGCWTAPAERWNGFFSLVLTGENTATLAVDRARSIPLFYGTQGNRLVIGDDAEAVRTRIGNPPLSPARVAEFLLAGYVLNESTLCDGIFQVQSGETVEISWDLEPGTWRTSKSRHRLFMPTGGGATDYESLLEEYDRVLTSCFERALRVTRGRPIVVPLSGGYDSRLLVLMLARLGARPALVYSYGGLVEETECSRLVAEAVGIPWHICDYSRNAWSEQAHAPDIWRYLRESSNLSTVGCIQEWLAVQQLRSKGLISSDSIFMPGYSADLPAGSFLSALGSAGRRGLLDREVFERLLWRDRLNQWDVRRLPAATLPAVASSLARSIDSLGPVRNWTSAYDAWMFAEKVPKFTVNAIRAFDLQGYDWWMPFFDEQFLRFWETVPDEFRLGERLHCDFADRLFCKLTGAEPPPRPPKLKYDSASNTESRVSTTRTTVRSGLRTIYRSRVATGLRRRYEHRAWLQAYRGDPMGWTSLYSEHEFLSMMRAGAFNINSLLVQRYLEMLGGETDSEELKAMLGFSPLS